MWVRLSNDLALARAKGRTQRQQEAIERKARLANYRIRALMSRAGEINGNGRKAGEAVKTEH